jgi:hypothetical protein
MQFIEDDKLPLDVVRKGYSEAEHALCCLECGFEYPFDSRQPHAISKPLYVLAMHNCAKSES